MVDVTLEAPREDAAVEAVYVEHGQHLYRSLLAYTGDVHLTEDAVAEAVFQKGLDDMDAFIKEGAVEPEALELEGLSPETLEQLKSLGYLGDDDEDSEETDDEPVEE